MNNTFPELASSYITIHPVRLTADTPHAEQAYSLLEPAQNYNFVGSRQKLSRAALSSRNVQPNRHSVAFVAIMHDGEDHSPIGYSQYSSDTGKDTQNLQVSVSTAHAGSDLAHTLATQLLDFAQDQGMRNVYASERRENIAMHELAMQLNMQQAVAQKSNKSRVTEKVVTEEDEILIYTLGL